MIEGGVEALGADRVFAGWLRDTDDPMPAVLQIRTGGQVVAEAVARGFRADLLAAGHGHGHYGFAGTLRAALPPGPTAFELYLPRRDQAIRVALTVPRLVSATPTRVELLFAAEATWTAADLARTPSCLGLAAQRLAMGTARFVDVTFRFLLCRWPSDAERAVYCAALDSGSLSPDGLLLEILHGRERTDLGGALASPWAPDFPYTQPIAAPARKRRGQGRRREVA